MLPATMEWKKDSLWLIDQRALPHKTVYSICRTYEDVACAIENMTVRGAPAIGVAAAYGLVLAESSGEFDAAAERLAATRPTAVNLFWAIERMKKVRREFADNAGLEKLLEEEAVKIHSEDIEMNTKIGKYGQEILPNDCRAVTHCNAGALATAGYGTALGVFRAASAAGKTVKIYACETRPRLQGASLTAYELAADGFDVTLITDSTAAFLMSRRKIDIVVTGADRVAMNGDTANKIGTYSLAIAAKHHNIPFYIAAPLSTFDEGCPTGRCIPIEERDGDEIRRIGSEWITLPDMDVWNPSFDITPSGLISGIITELGVIRAPYEKNIKEILSGRK